MERSKIIICLFVLELLAGNASADIFKVHVTDSNNQPVSIARVDINACGMIKHGTTNDGGTCTFEVSKTCNDILVYVGSILMWSGKYQAGVIIRV